MHLRGLRRSRLLQQSEWHRWGEAGSGCSLLGAFPKELPFPDPCCSPQVMECCSSCGVLILLPSCWQHKPLYLLQREIASCKGKEKINMVYALGQLCQCSVLCRSTAPRPTVCNLAAGFPFNSSIQNPLGTAKVLAFQSGFSRVLLTWFTVALWHSDGWRKDGGQGESLARAVQTGNDVLSPGFSITVRHALLRLWVTSSTDVKGFAE